MRERLQNSGSIHYFYRSRQIRQSAPVSGPISLRTGQRERAKPTILYHHGLCIIIETLIFTIFFEAASEEIERRQRINCLQSSAIGAN
jgi:hypothetical protein